MSGGVDSSMAAALLQQDGYECTGVFMCLGQVEREGAGQGCCSPTDSADARQVADRLGIPFYILNFQKDIERIIHYFVAEYRRARTPNPCILCNRDLKFGKLLEYARMIGAEYVATGHYAQLLDLDGQRRLCRGRDLAKDQSYALFGLARENLARVLLPVGRYTKQQIRHLAREMNLPVHDKAESQEICFVPDDDYARLVAQRAPEICKPGPVVNTAGEYLGEHQGIYRYTIGQRRGLGIALGQPAYVVRLDAEKNEVVLGSWQELHQSRLYADNVNWLIDPPPVEPFDAMVQIRYNHRGAPARVTPITDDHGNPGVRVDFTDPIAAITPGQAAVFYDSHQAVLGGAWIAHTPPPDTP